MRITALTLALALLAAGDSSEMRRTRADMRSLSTSAEAYFTDHGEYPQAKTMEELRAKLSPVYIKTVPMTDGGGPPCACRASRGKNGHYRFVSAGPNRKFDPTSLDLGKRPAKSDDIIYADVELIRSQPPLRQVSHEDLALPRRQRVERFADQRCLLMESASVLLQWLRLLSDVRRIAGDKKIADSDGGVRGI